MLKGPAKLFKYSPRVHAPKSARSTNQMDHTVRTSGTDNHVIEPILINV
jgi:hypothetical protein